MDKKLLCSAVLMFVMAMSMTRVVKGQADACDTKDSASFERGDVVVVNPGEAQNVREEPTVDAELVQAVPAGEYLTVWDGPTCAEGYTWWQVEYDRQTGWTAEAPADGGATWLSKIEMKTLEQESLRFTYEPSLLSGLEVEDWDWQAHIANYIPPLRQYTLLDYPVLTDDRPEFVRSTANITIYPRGEDEDAELSLGGNLATIRNAPLVPGALMTFIPLPKDRFDVPQQAFLPFKGGLGLRVIGYFEQTLQLGPGSYTPIEPYYGYSFRGFTDDDAYYVRAYFPLKVDVTLPPFPAIPTTDFSSGDNNEEGNRSYSDYSRQVRELIESLPPEAFTPRIALLDALVRSLEITEPIELHFEPS